jgi:LysR family transcriptional activator of nhaA
MAELNYHHLRYFREIARERSLTRAAQKLHVSQSALSIQLRRLEERLGQPLFERQGRRLLLTEAGRIALDHAEAIFSTGDELVGTLKGRPRGRQALLRVGAVATLSRNFQLQWLKPLLARGDLQIRLQSGGLQALAGALQTHALDVVLSNEPAPRERGAGLYSRLIDEQAVTLVSRRRRGAAHRLRFPQDLDGLPLLLPGGGSALRASFDAALDLAGVQVRVIAEVDDMAMLRLMARESGLLALVPPVVVRDELNSGVLVERCSIPQISERFYAITGRRRFMHPLLKELLAA